MTIETNFDPATIVLGTRTIFPGSTGNSSGIGNANANAQYVQKYTATQTFTALSGNILWYANGGTPKTRFLVYSDSGGIPAALLSASNELTSVPSSEATWVEYVLTNPVSIVSGQSYWIGWAEDVGQFVYVDYSAAAVPFRLASNTYANGPLNPWSSQISSGNNYVQVYIADKIRLAPVIDNTNKVFCFFNAD